jgi:hypothetical protein
MRSLGRRRFNATMTERSMSVARQLQLSVAATQLR